MFTWSAKSGKELVQLCTAFLFFSDRRKKVMVYDKVKCKIASDGGVAEQGSPKELLEKNGVFAQMVKLQTEGQNWSIA